MATTISADHNPFISQDLYLNNISLDGLLITPGGSSIAPSSGIVINVVGTNYTYQTNNNGDTIHRSNGGVAMFDTLPEAEDAVYYPNGWVVWIENTDSTADLTIIPEVSTINGLTSLVLSPQSTARIISDGANYSAVISSSTGTSSLVNLQTETTYTYLTTDRGKTVERNSGTAAMTDILPEAGSVEFPDGWFTTIVNTGTTAPNVVPVTFASNLTLSSTLSTINNEEFIIIPAGSTCRVVSDGANWIASVESNYGNTGNPIFNPNGVIIQPGGLQVVNQNLYGWGTTPTALSVNAETAAGNKGGVMGSFVVPSAVSSYSGRDKVAMYVGMIDLPTYLSNVFTASYTTTSVTLTAPVSTKELAINMLIDTNDISKYTGIITGWVGTGTTTSTINVSGWYQVDGQTLSSVELASGGSGYSVGNILTIVGIGAQWPAYVTVNTVNGSGTVLTFTLTYGGAYSYMHPSAGFTYGVKGGTGTGATFTVLVRTVISGNTAPGQIPHGSQIDINPNVTIWGSNIAVQYVGYGYAHPEASNAIGLELDIVNSSGIVDNNTTQMCTGILLGSGTTASFAGYQSTGSFYNCYMAGNGNCAVANAGFLYFPTNTSTATGFLSNQVSGYLIQSLSTTGSTSFAVTTGNGQVDMGNFGIAGIASTPVINFHSASQAVSGTYNTYDSKIEASAGVDGTDGRGILTYTAGNHIFTSPTTAIGSYLFQPAGATSLMLSRVTSAVNYISITGSISGGDVAYVGAVGADTNVSLVLKSQGSGGIVLQSNGTTSLIVSNPASAVNTIFIGGSVTGSATVIHNGGSDTNIPLVIYTQGTGAISLNPGNGYGLQILGSSTAVTGLVVTASAAASTDLLINTYGTVNNIRINPPGASTKIGVGTLLAPSETFGFLMIPTINGTPTGVPTGNSAGDTPICFDSADNKIYVYSNAAAAWKGVTVS